MLRNSLTTALILAVAGGGALGCKANERPQTKTKQRCDQDRLAALASELDAAEPDARIALVSEGLLAACGDELYPTVRSLLAEVAKPDDDARAHGLTEDQKFRAAVEHICTKHEQIGKIMSSAARHERGLAVAELCEFSRYELLNEAELRELSGHALFVWVTHDFLLESGTPPERAKTISRALFRLHEESTAAVLIHSRHPPQLVALPAAAPLRPGPVIYISSSELVFNEQQLSTLDAGRLPAAVVQRHVVMPLFELLEEETEKMLAVVGEHDRETHALLVVDAGVTFSSVVDTVYTASRLGYEHFDFVVEPIYPVKRAIYIDPPHYSSAFEPPPPQFKVVILDDGYRVSWGPDEAAMLPKLDPAGRGPDAWDRPGLAKLVREQTTANPELKAGILSAENTVTMDIVLTTYAVMLGPDCRQHEDGAGCLLPQLILEAGAG